MYLHHNRQCSFHVIDRLGTSSRFVKGELQPQLPQRLLALGFSSTRSSHAHTMCTRGLAPRFHSVGFSCAFPHYLDWYGGGILFS